MPPCTDVALPDATAPASPEFASLAAATYRGDAALIDRFAADWQALSRETPTDWAFYTPSWLHIWYGVFGKGRPLVLVTVRDASRLLAIAPFIEETRGPLRLWRAPTNVYAGKADIVVHPDRRDRILDVLWQEIERHPWHAIDWRLAPEDGAMTALAARRTAAGQPVVIRQSHRTPLVPLGEGVDVARIGPHKHLRRHHRQLEKIGSLVEVATIPATGAQLETFFRLEAAGWKGRLGTDAGNDPDSAAFHRALIELPKQGDFVTTAHELRLDGQTIAIEIGFRSGTRHFAHKGAYDETWHRYSPGQLSARFLMRDAQATGYATFDFLGNDEPYKMLWTDTTEAIFHHMIFRKDPAGRVIHRAMAQGIPLVKRLRSIRVEAAVRTRARPSIPAAPLRSLRQRLRAVRPGRPHTQESSMLQTIRHKARFGVALLREGRIGPILHAGRVIVWSETRGYGLKRDLTVPHSAPEATIPITVREATARDVAIIFDTTGADVPESERADRRDRAVFFHTGVRTCYVAVDEHGTPCFFQAALDADQNAFIQRAWKGGFPQLEPHQTLLENAFTPEAFRGRRIMPAAMARIAEAHASETVREAITFVDTDNIPSLKGCVRAGFSPYCTRLVTRRFFRSRTVFTPLPAGTGIPGVTDR